MAKENILLPAMSDQMTDAELLSWKISAGDKVNKGDILCEISTDKVDTVSYTHLTLPTIAQV